MRFLHWVILIAMLVVLAWCLGEGEAAILDNAVHPPPTCGTYAYDSYTPASAGFPTVGQTFLDPVFGETFTRLSTIYPTTGGSGIIYSVNGLWNADSTAFLHDDPGAGVSLIHPTTGAVIQAVVPYAPTGAVSFSPTNADIYYYTNGNLLSQYSISGNSSSTVKDFGAALGGLGQSSDWIDRTGTYFLLNLAGNFRIWNRVTDTLYSGSIAVPGGANGIPPGWAGLSPNGNYLIVSQTPEKTSYAINHGTTTLSTAGVLFWDAGATDHGDVVSASDGNTYMMTVNTTHTLAGSSRHYFRVLVTNAITPGSSTQLSAPGNQMLLPVLSSNTAGNGHVACGATGTYQDWCYADISDPADLLGNPGTWYAYRQELFMVHLLPPFEIRRLMHHRARPFRGYCRQIRPSANWDGTKVIFPTPFSAPDSADCGYSDIWRYNAP